MLSWASAIEHCKRHKSMVIFLNTGAKVRISERKAKEKSIFICFSERELFITRNKNIYNIEKHETPDYREIIEHLKTRKARNRGNEHLKMRKERNDRKDLAGSQYL